MQTPPASNVTDGLLTTLRAGYAPSTSHPGALVHGTQLAWLMVDALNVWGLTSDATAGASCTWQTLAELQAATPTTDGSGAYLLGTVRRVLSLVDGAAIASDEPGNPPP